jgi:addiction module HigA family antidote
MLDAAQSLEFLKYHREIVSKPFVGSAKANTAFALTINFESAYDGPMMAPTMSKSLIATDTEATMFKNGMRPIHPGEILKEGFLILLDLSANALARALKVPAPRINDIVRQRRGVSADTALRLARYFGGDARSWLNLRVSYDLRMAEKAGAKRVEREVQPVAAA